MTVLIVTAMKSAWPFIPELVENLNNSGKIKRVDILDIEYVLKLKFVSCLCKFPIIGALIKMISCYVWMLGKRYDVINIHYVSPFYRYLVSAFARRGRLVCTFWGSDFYRINLRQAQTIKKILKHAQCVTSSNNDILQKIALWEIGIPLKFVRFGLGSFKELKKLISSASKTAVRRNYDISDEKTVIAVGYNAIEEQQHLKILNELALLSPELKTRLVILLQMSYPINKKYTETVRAQATKTGIDFLMFDSFLSSQDVSKLRFISDIVINMQTTDCLSASIQEGLFCGNKLIYGSWLPYSVFEEMGLNVYKVDSFHQINSRLLEVMELPARMNRDDCSKVLENFSGWKATINGWIGVYEGTQK